jgi:hypothetical protein
MLRDKGLIIKGLDDVVDQAGSDVAQADGVLGEVPGS